MDDEYGIVEIRQGAGLSEMFSMMQDAQDYVETELADEDLPFFAVMNNAGVAAIFCDGRWFMPAPESTTAQEFRIGLDQAMNGETRPLSELWTEFHKDDEG